MNDLDYSRAVAALEATQNQLREINASVDGIREYGRTNRRHIKWVAVTLALDIMLTLGGIWIFHNVANNHSAFITSCENSNVVRAHDVLLWDHVLTLANQHHLTVAQKASDARFRAFVADTFKKVDCTAIK